MDARDKVAVVTGAGRGIGRAIAVKLAQAGAEVAILYRKKPEPAAAVKAEIEKAGRRCEAYQCDVSDPELVHDTFEKIKEGFSRIDVLVNNAGLASWGNFIADTSFLEWDKVMRANLYGPYNCIREALPIMRAQKGGHIINVSSILGKRSRPKLAVYTACKHAVEGFSRSLLGDANRFGIKISILAPAAIRTEWAAKAGSTLPEGVRLLAPEEVARMAECLIETDAHCNIWNMDLIALEQSIEPI